MKLKLLSQYITLLALALCANYALAMSSASSASATSKTSATESKAPKITVTPRTKGFHDRWLAQTYTQTLKNAYAAIAAYKQRNLVTYQTQATTYSAIQESKAPETVPLPIQRKESLKTLLNDMPTDVIDLITAYDHKLYDQITCTHKLVDSKNASNTCCITNVIAISNNLLATCFSHWSCSSDKTITLWHLNNDATLARTSTLNGHTERVNCIIPLPNGQFASGSEDEAITIWKPITKTSYEPIKTIKTYYAVLTLTQLPNGDLASGGSYSTGASYQTGIVSLWPIKTNPTFTGSNAATFDEAVSCITALASGLLAIGFANGEVRILESQNNEEPYVVSHLHATDDRESAVYCIRELANHNLAVGTEDGRIAIWEYNTAQQNGTCTQQWRGHSLAIAALNELSDGTLLSSSYDETIKFWKFNGKEFDECVATLTSDGGAIPSLALLPNGMLATGTASGIIQLWQ